MKKSIVSAPWLRIAVTGVAVVASIVGIATAIEPVRPALLFPLVWAVIVPLGLTVGAGVYWVLNRPWGKDQ